MSISLAPRFAVALLACLCSYLPCLAESGKIDTTVVVGDQAKPSELAQAIKQAYDGGASKIVIRKGVYVLPRSTDDFLVLQRWNNVVVDGTGATIIADGQPTLFRLNECKNVTLSGASFTQKEMTVYQGRVLALHGCDPASGRYSCDWALDTGYPSLPLDSDKFPAAKVIDATTRQFKIGVGDFYSLKYSPIGSHTYSLSGLPNNSGIAVGDWIVARRDSGVVLTRYIHLGFCENCTVKGVTLTRNGFSPIVEIGGVGGNHIIGCKWLLGRKPAGATEEPLVSTMADGFHSTGTIRGPDIEDCVMDGPLLDDCIAIHGTFQDVVSMTGTTLVVKNRWGQLTRDKPIRYCTKNGFAAEATIVSSLDNGDNTSTLVLDHEINAPEGEAKVYNPLACGAGYKILNCKIGHTRSRGILVKGDNGTIRGNTIVDCGMSAISIGPEYYWLESGYVHNVLIERNAIGRCGGAGYGGSAIFVHGEGTKDNSQIVIVNNKLSQNYLGDITIQWARDVKVAWNDFVGFISPPSRFPPQKAIAISDSSSVTLERNTLGSTPGFPQSSISIGANVDQLRGTDSNVNAATH